MNKLSTHEIEVKLYDIINQFLIDSETSFSRPLHLNLSLQRHLGVDSIGRAELFHRIEKSFSITLPDSLLAEAETIEDLARYLEKVSGEPQKNTEKKAISSHEDHATVDPSTANSLIDLLLLYAEKVPNKPHIYFQEEDGSETMITYGQLFNSASQVAFSLKERGLREGDTVAIMQPTHPNFFYIFFGTLLAGGVPVPIYPPFRKHMLEAYAKTEARILKSAETRFLVTFDKAEKLSRLLQNFVPSLKVVTTVEGLLQPTPLTKFYHAKGDNFAFIQYTSGSTNDPKGVLLSHYNLLSNIRAYGKAARASDQDICVSWLPLYHDLGLIGMWLGSLYHGAPLVLMTPFSFLNHPERWLWAIHNHRGTISGAPNFAYELCIKKIEPALIEGLDLSSWRVAINGAEKVYPRTLDAFCKKFASVGFRRTTMMPVYGLAETAVALTLPPTLDRDYVIDRVDRTTFEEQRVAVPTENAEALEFVGCGVPLEGHEIRIVDDVNNLLDARHVGNLQFRGPSTMQGYYNNPEATKAVFHDGGWVSTGDLAYVVDKELFITGRRKDLIIKAGRNLYPAEIEEIVGNVLGVRQGCVAAFGTFNENRGTEELVVVAETREQNKLKREAIADAIHQAIVLALDIPADHVVLTAPHMVPKTSSGKLQRAACKKMYENSELSKRKTSVWLQVTKLASKGYWHKTLSILAAVSKFIYTTYLALIGFSTFLLLHAFVSVSSVKNARIASKYWSRFILFVGCCPLKIIGADNLKIKSPVIYTCNHASYIDAIVMLAVLPAGTRFVGKKELLSTPFLKTFMQKLDFIPVDRIDSAQGVQDTKVIETILQRGESIMIFPEGTFGYASGLRPFRLGAFKVAAETNTPICPIGMQGTRKILRENEKLVRPGKITLIVSPPVMPEGSEWQAISKLKTTVRNIIAKHCGEPSLDFIVADKIAPTQQRVKNIFQNQS